MRKKKEMKKARKKLDELKAKKQTGTEGEAEVEKLNYELLDNAMCLKNPQNLSNRSPNFT